MFEKLKTRDNFWNIIFLVGISTSIAIAEHSDNLLVFFLSLIVAPYLFSRFNKVTFTADNIFINSEGESLEKRYPVRLPMIFTVNFLVNIPIITNFAGSLSFADMAFIFFTIPTTYFIYLNCPITILFNPNSWDRKIIRYNPSEQSVIYTPNTFSVIKYKRPDNFILDPKYSGLSSNISNPNHLSLDYLKRSRYKD
jgi:hypothetical protein